MVSDFAIGGLTVLGGAISGVIGIGYSEYTQRRERVRQVKSWYDTTIQLANRVERLASEDFEASGDYIGDALSGIVGKLAGHLMDAPNEADGEVVQQGEELAERCDRARKFIRGERMHNSRADTDDTNPLKSAIEQAEIVRRQSENARSELSWL